MSNGPCTLNALLYFEHSFVKHGRLMEKDKTPHWEVLGLITISNAVVSLRKIIRIFDGVEAETRKSQASFQIIQVSSEALPRMRLE